MPRMEFKTYDEALKAAKEKIPCGRKPLLQRNSRELHSIRILGHWIIGARTSFRLTHIDKWVPVDREFCDIETFQSEMSQIMNNTNIHIYDWYMYQSSNDPTQPIILQSLENIPLDVQLSQYTGGDGYNVIDFHDIDSPTCLTPVGTIVHRKTGQRFKVPAVPVERLLQAVS